MNNIFFDVRLMKYKSYFKPQIKKCMLRNILIGLYIWLGFNFEPHIMALFFKIYANNTNYDIGMIFRLSIRHVLGYISEAFVSTL